MTNMEVMYDANVIANYFLQKESMSLMKLQKLVYFAHGWHLAIYDKPLLDECIQAAPYGPVVRTLYDKFIKYGRKPIKEMATELIVRIERETLDCLNRIWEVYGKYTAVQLSNAAHIAGSPWDEINQHYNETIPKNAVIPDELIKNYFIGLTKNEKTITL